MTARLDRLTAIDAKAAAMDLVDSQRLAGGQLAGWMDLSLLGARKTDPARRAGVAAAMAAMGLAHGGTWFGGSGDDSAAGSSAADTTYSNGESDTLLRLAGNEKRQRWRGGARKAPRTAANASMFEMRRAE